MLATRFSAPFFFSIQIFTVKYVPALSPSTLSPPVRLLDSKFNMLCFSQNVGRKMSANDFIENLRDLNDGRNFDAAMLQDLYASIKNQPLEMEL